MLEVHNITDNLMLAELSADDVDSVLEEFDLTNYSFHDSPIKSVPSFETDSTSVEKCATILESFEGTESTVTTPDSFVDSPMTSVTTSFEKFARISKSLEGTVSSSTTPDTFVDIVQQALHHPSVFGPDGCEFSFE